MSVVKWKFNDVDVEVNPANFLRPMRSGASYTTLTDGTQVRINPENRPKQDFVILWPNIGLTALTQIKSLLGQKVTVKTHLNETFDLYFDEIDVEEATGSGSTPRFVVRLTAREA